MEPWWHQCTELLGAGLRAEAIAITRAAADRGSLGAFVRLARFGEEAGIPREEADRMVEKALAQVSDHDATAHWNLYSASELLLGSCEPEEKYHRIQRHLEQYVRASGDPHAALAVARRYANGTAVLAPDVELAVDWYYCAIALGSKEAKLDVAAIVGDA
jgi:hypothetical protein